MRLCSRSGNNEIQSGVSSTSTLPRDLNVYLFLRDALQICCIHSVILEPRLRNTITDCTVGILQFLPTTGLVGIKIKYHSS